MGVVYGFGIRIETIVCEVRMNKKIYASMD